jgi:N-carbamoyl-L-amino-acid hydrolase
MDLRRDAGLAAAAAMLEIARIPEREGGVATTGELRLEPGIPTAVAGRGVLSVDLRHPDAAALARMFSAAADAAEAAASARECSVERMPLWRIEPIPFDGGLVAAAREACAEVTGEPAELESGALHDAAEVARVLPAAMLFAPSARGISHAPEEDTDETDLAVAIEAFGLAANRVAGTLQA